MNKQLAVVKHLVDKGTNLMATKSVARSHRHAQVQVAAPSCSAARLVRFPRPPSSLVSVPHRAVPRPPHRITA
jgi:hypothetical protein